MASGLFVPTFRDALDASQNNLNLSSTTDKTALFTSSLGAVNFGTDTAYGVGPFAANEVTGTGYTAGGLAIAAPTFALSGGLLVFDLTDPAWGGSTLSNVQYLLHYAASLAGDEAVCLVDFGTTYNTVSGTLTVQVAANGLWNLDLIP